MKHLFPQGKLNLIKNKKSFKKTYQMKFLFDIQRHDHV